MQDIPSLGLSELREAYRLGRTSPNEVVGAIMRRIRSAPLAPVWTYVLDDSHIDEQLQRIKAAESTLPLYGVPFAMKDNMDIEGHPTTAGCPDFSYIATDTAPAVEALMAAGAIMIGKTAMDQFANGTTGTRSPHGPCPSALDPELISGGSSSGSANAVASNLVSFSLGTDTAGSGRIPAAFNGIVGLKPTRGMVSIRGIIPACRSIDCVSVFANSVDDANQVLSRIKGFDPAEAFSRPAQMPVREIACRLNGATIGIPAATQLEFYGSNASRLAFAQAVEDLKTAGATVVEIDFSDFQEVCRMIYEGPWMAERYSTLMDFIESHPNSLHPVTYAAISGSTRYSASDVFVYQHRLMELKRRTDTIWQEIDAMVTPTAPRTYRISEILADPVKLNNNLGHYTNCVNLLDLCAIAVPAKPGQDGRPFGIMFVAPAWNDDAVSTLAKDFESGISTPPSRMSDNA